MKNLRTLFTRLNKLNTNKLLNKHFTENVKSQAAKDYNINKEETKDDTVHEEIKDNIEEEGTNNTQSEQKQSTYKSNVLGRFTSLFKHTFNLGDSIEKTMSKRKAEAAIKKAAIVELTDEQADEVSGLYYIVREKHRGVEARWYRAILTRAKRGTY
jgi:hypothetical protein